MTPLDRAWAAAAATYNAAVRRWAEGGHDPARRPKFVWHPTRGARIRSTTGRITKIRIRTPHRAATPARSAEVLRPRQRKQRSRHTAAARGDPDSDGEPPPGIKSSAVRRQFRTAQVSSGSSGPDDDANRDADANKLGISAPVCKRAGSPPHPGATCQRRA